MALAEGLRSKKVAVIGGGQMGSGIAEVFARSGFAATIVEANPEVSRKIKGNIASSYDKAVGKGKMTAEQKELALGRLLVVGSVEDLSDQKVLVEAVPERLGLKTDIFRKADRVLPQEAVLFSNTSSLPVRELAAVTNRSEQVAGMHFFNPAPVMRLVEVARAEHSSDDTVQLAVDLAKELGKTPVRVEDSPGFVVNRLLIPYLVDAAKMVQGENGQLDIRMREIDQTMTESGEAPMGPFALSDLIGLDTTLEIYDILRAAFPHQYEPAPQMLRRYVAEGLLGRKTGRGFYDYSNSNGGTVSELVVPDTRQVAILDRLHESLVNGAVTLANEGIATPEGIDTAMKLGTGMKKGPFELQNTTKAA